MSSQRIDGRILRPGDRSHVRVSGQSRPQEALAPFEKETLVTSAMIVVTASDRAVTAKERSRSPIGHAVNGAQWATVRLVLHFRHPYAGTAPSQSRLCHWRLLHDFLTK